MITQEDFDKLKQSDRIELLLREERLDERKRSLNSGWLGLVWLLFGIIGFIILLALQFLILGLEESCIATFNLIPLIMKIVVFVIVFGVSWDLIKNLVIFPKWYKKLESYFFKKEVKPKR